MKCIKKIEQIPRNSCRFIFHEYCRDTDTSLPINWLNLDSLYARRLFFVFLCMALFRPHFEYGDVIWYPCLRRQSAAVEDVKRATKVVKEICHFR